MDKKHSLKPMASALGITLATAVAAGVAQADTNPFTISEISSGYQVADDHEGRCGEGRCGGKDEEGKCGEGKCGDKEGEGKCGEGKCGDKEGEGKCGEGKCGES